MLNHVLWADGELLKAVTSGVTVPDEAIRECAHLIAAEEVWLARLENRSPRFAVWPSVSRSDMESIVRQTHDHWESYLKDLTESAIRKSVTYTNSAGREFKNTVGDILVHVALHGQYHRGKINLMLRQAGLTPAPVDYIAFVRGSPAATEADARGEHKIGGTPTTI